MSALVWKCCTLVSAEVLVTESADSVEVDSKRRRSTKVFEFNGKRRQLVRMPSKEELFNSLSDLSLDDDDDDDGLYVNEPCMFHEAESNI